MNNFPLNLVEFEENIVDSFRKLRDQRMNCGTLATDDSQQMQAHKIILTAGSGFLGGILMSERYSNMLIYLKQTNNVELKHIFENIKIKEAFVHQEEIKVYIESGKELKVKHLVSELKEIDENGKSEPAFHIKNGDEAFVSLPDDNYEKQSKLDTNDQLEQQLGDMVERIDNCWRCKHCGKTMTKKRDIQMHAEIHIVGILHPCHQCGKTFSTRGSLRVHISSIHTELVSCEVCGKSGMNKHSYRKHKSRQHKTFSTISHNAEFSINPLVRKDDLESYEDILNNDISQNDVTETDQENDNIDTSDMVDVTMDVDCPAIEAPSPEKRFYKCTKCDASFKGHSGLIQHNRRIHEGILYSCEHCGHKASDKSNLKKHQESVHEGLRYCCDQCDYQAKQQVNIRRHKESVHEGIRYSCNQCDYQATQQNYLETHKSIVHEGIKYSCTHCDYQATRKDNLRAHKRSFHEGVRYHCDLCKFHTGWKNKLRKHKQRMHLADDQSLTKNK